MVIRLTSKHQITIPKTICGVFDLKKGDVLEIQQEGQRIVMIPQEVVFEPRYPKDDLEAAEKTLTKGVRGQEIGFSSGASMIRFLKKRIKK